MASNASTPEPGGSGCCPCGTTSDQLHNCTPTPWPSSVIGQTINGTILNAKLDQTLYFSYNSQNKTVCGPCPTAPLRQSEMSLGLTRLGGQEAAYFCYPDGWKPGGVGGIFNFLPHVNTFNVPTPSYRRVYSEEGTLAFDASDLPQAELAVSAKRDATYFTTYEERSGVYFEYFAGTEPLLANDARFGRVNRRYDQEGNTQDYSYSNNVQGRALLRAIYAQGSGPLGGRVVPYFYYADENIDAAAGKWAPITKIHTLNLDDFAQSRTTYFDYQNYTDVVTGLTYPYLKRIVNPAGCVQEYDPIVPFNDIQDVNQIKRDIDPEGYQTYFSYTAGALNRTTEPEGRITYYEYLTTGETRKTFLGRPTSYTKYSLAAGGGQMPLVTKERDELGNSSYFTYDATLARMTKEIRPNGNVTYYEYVGGTAANKYALRKRIQKANAAQTYYGYDGEKYDLAKEVGPRHTSSFKGTTYYRYDATRGRIAMVDALGYETLYGRDAQGRQIREQDARGYTAYFNYNTQTGNLDSRSDAESDVAYFGYSPYRDLLAQVSPRWPEAGMYPFTTYYVYNARSQRTKAIDPLRNTTYFDWTTRGDLLATVDARGTEREYTYNGLRLVTRETVTDGSGIQLADTKHGYDIYKNRLQTQDGLGNTTYYFYDAIDRPIAQRDALGQTSYFQYDKVGSRTAVRDARNVSTYYKYDLLSRNTAMRDALGGSTYFDYDVANNRTKALDARRNATYFFYDELDRLQATRDALLNPAYFYFDEVGNRKAVKDARFNATYYFYDRANRATVTKDALGGVTYFTYDRAGNVTRTTDARGSSGTATFDTLDRQTAALDPVGNATSYQYDGVGNRTVVARGGGSAGYGIQPYGTSPYGGGGGGPITYFSYDGLNRNTAVKDPLGNQTYFFYDPVSNRTAVRNPLLHTTYFGYDKLQRMTRVMDPLLRTTYFEFDAVGNQTRVIDPNTRQTMTRYDLLNRPDAVRFPDTGSAYFFYDQVGNRTRDLDPRGNTSYYGYDALNRATRLADALFRTVYFEYDAVSNLSREIGAEKEQTAYTYDALNRRTNIAYTPAGSITSAGLSSAPYFVYDPVGNLTQMGDLWGLHRMGYDAANRLATHQYPQGSVVYYEYDRRWNVTGTVYPGSAGVARAAYDTIDRQTKLQAPSGATAYFTYDAASNNTQRLLGNLAKFDMTYDLAERLATWRTSKSSGAPLSYFDYTRDSKGLVTKALREANYATYYGYDENDRLVHEIWAQAIGSPTEVYGYRYAYDKAGNRTKARVNGVNTYYFYDRANQLTVRGTNAVYATPTYYWYDRNGSLTNIKEPTGSTYFAYNTAGLVAKLRWRDASSSYFYYDGMLRRYAMIAAGTSAATYFLWEGMNLLQERNADGSVKEEHANAQTPIGGIAQLVQTYRPAEAAALQMIYPVMDWRGTITKWVQSDGTTVLASREYDAFGGLIPGSSAGTWPGRFGYQGQAWIEIGSADAAQRLLLSPTRVYEPGIGSFLESDIELRDRARTKDQLPQDSLMRYSLNRHSPLHFVDPSGLQDDAGTAAVCIVKAALVHLGCAALGPQLYAACFVAAFEGSKPDIGDCLEVLAKLGADLYKKIRKKLSDSAPDKGVDPRDERIDWALVDRERKKCPEPEGGAPRPPDWLPPVPKGSPYTPEQYWAKDYPGKPPPVPPPAPPRPPSTPKDRWESDYRRVITGCGPLVDEKVETWNVNGELMKIMTRYFERCIVRIVLADDGSPSLRHPPERTRRY